MENDPTALAELEVLGLRNVPVTVLGGKAIVGFNREELARTFELSAEGARKVAGAWLFETFDKILRAVIQAVVEVPPDRLMWRSPDRGRPLKVFCYHILADPNHVLDAIASQRYDGSFKLTYAEACERFHDMQAIASFGEESRERIGAASTALTAEELERPIAGYAGQTNGHELLHQVLSHTAHHLRQLYEMLRMIGVEPAAPLKDEEFKGIPLPRELW